jgi:hypothetical protein
MGAVEQVDGEEVTRQDRYDTPDWPNLQLLPTTPEDAMAMHIGGSARWLSCEAE